VTTGTYTATDTSIATYNADVMSDAALNASLPTTTWTAVGSTSAVNAIDNIACTPDCSSDPIYLVNGTEVASSATTASGELFSGALMTAIDVAENGTTVDNHVWTGATEGGRGVTVRAWRRQFRDHRLFVVLGRVGPRCRRFRPE
jgi:hypothetical protein